jgi:hypothetical protein
VTARWNPDGYHLPGPEERAQTGISITGTSGTLWIPRELIPDEPALAGQLLSDLCAAMRPAPRADVTPRPVNRARTTLRRLRSGTLALVRLRRRRSAR